MGPAWAMGLLHHFFQYSSSKEAGLHPCACAPGAGFQRCGSLAVEGKASEGTAGDSSFFFDSFVERLLLSAQ